MASEENRVDTSQDPTDIDDQMEMFLYKFPEVGRESITELKNQFMSFATKGANDLEEDQAMRLLEARGETRTFRELREMVSDIDLDHNRRLSLLEWATAIYEKSWVELHTFTDRAAMEAALRHAQEARAAAAAAQAAIEEAKAEEERVAAERAAEIEAEAKLTGVAGMAAFFRRQAEATQDETMTNEQRIKAEAARRKAKREADKEAKRAEEEAEQAKHSAEHAQEEIARQRAEAEAEAQAKEEAEKAEQARRRAEFKARQRAMFEKNSS